MTPAKTVVARVEQGGSGPWSGGARTSLRRFCVFRSADGRVESSLISPGGSAPGLELYELRLAPKAVHKSEAHSKGTTETVVVLKGALRVIVGDVAHELLAGDSMFFRADLEHTYENRASHEARCLDVIHYGRQA